MIHLGRSINIIIILEDHTEYYIVKIGLISRVVITILCKKLTCITTSPSPAMNVYRQEFPGIQDTSPSPTNPSAHWHAKLSPSGTQSALATHVGSPTSGPLDEEHVTVRQAEEKYSCPGCQYR